MCLHVFEKSKIINDLPKQQSSKDDSHSCNRSKEGRGLIIIVDQAKSFEII